MIHVAPVPEPPGFDAEVRQKGNAWLLQSREGTPPAYWTAFAPHLAAGFNDRCGYGAMYEPKGTVDHYIGQSECRCFIYEWRNYRFCSGWMNSSKSTGSSGGLRVLDPFEVQDGWFEIILPSLQLRVTEKVPDELRERAKYTLSCLHLCDDERVVRQRRHWMEEYERTGDIGVLERHAPLLARAVEKQTKVAE